MQPAISRAVGLWWSVLVALTPWQRSIEHQHKPFCNFAPSKHSFSLEYLNRHPTFHCEICIFQNVSIDKYSIYTIEHNQQSKQLQISPTDVCGPTNRQRSYQGPIEASTCKLHVLSDLIILNLNLNQTKITIIIQNLNFSQLSRTVSTQ